MSDDLLRYYNRELAFFRRMSSEFATTHSKIAGRLRLGPDASEDPHVERLIEAFALLSARTRLKIEDEFPEISDALLEVLYPHYLRPVPSMSVVKFHLDPGQTELTEGHRVERYAEIDTEPIQGEPVRFRACYPVTLWPVEVVQAQLSGIPFSAPTTPHSAAAAAVVHIHLRTLGGEIPMGDLQVESHRFFIRGLPQHTFALYEALLNGTLEVAIARSPNDPQPLLLPPSAVHSIGLGADEGMLPYSAQSMLGYRLLTEFFTFPQKFLFFDLSGIDQRLLGQFEADMHVYFYLKQTSIDLEQNVTAETFQLGCAPVVNLFRQRTEPITLDNTSYEYRIQPDVRRPLALEVYSTDQVTAIGPDGEEISCRAYYSIQHAGRPVEHQPYWHTTRRAAADSAGEVDHGTELDLSITDIDHYQIEQEGWFLDVETTCLNRDLPSRLPFGGGQPNLFLVGGEGIIERVECLIAPTPTRRPPRRQEAMWRLISHLSLGHLSITGGEDGATALREILTLYDIYDSEDTRAMIDAIRSVQSRRVVGRVPGHAEGGFCRGVEIEIVFDPQRFTQNELFLFATVLERFLGMYCSMNSFTRLVARVEGQEGELRRWQPRSGERVLA